MADIFLDNALARKGGGCISSKELDMAVMEDLRSYFPLFCSAIISLMNYQTSPAIESAKESLVRLEGLPYQGTNLFLKSASRSEERRVGKECVSTWKFRW